MPYKFEALLKKENIQESELSTSLKKRIADLRKLEQAIPTGKDRLANGNLSVKKAEDLRKTIADSEAAISQIDDQLVAGITKWIPNREKFKAQGEKLAEARNARRDGAPAATPAVPASAAPGNGSGAALVKPAPAKPTIPAVPEPKKEGMGFWGYALVGIAAVALGVAGYHAVNNFLNKQA